MNKHEELLNTFYTALAQRDFETMKRCYHPQAEFQDEVFTLKGKEIGAMWHMLCENGKDLSVRFDGVAADNNQGKAHWIADYTFSATGRMVNNDISATLEFKDGKIFRHRDSFDFWRWSRQSLGMAGVVLGWSPLLKNKVKKMANGKLQQFIKKHSEYQA